MGRAPRSLRLLTAGAITLAVAWPLSALIGCQAALMCRGSNWSLGLNGGSIQVSTMRMQLTGADRMPPWMLAVTTVPMWSCGNHVHLDWWFHTGNHATPAPTATQFSMMSIPAWAPLAAIILPTCLLWRRRWRDLALAAQTSN